MRWWPTQERVCKRLFSGSGKFMHILRCNTCMRCVRGDCSKRKVRPHVKTVSSTSGRRYQEHPFFVLTAEPDMPLWIIRACSRDAWVSPRRRRARSVSVNVKLTQCHVIITQLVLLHPAHQELLSIQDSARSAQWAFASPPPCMLRPHAYAAQPRRTRIG
jgi:hypothetical protein